MRKILLLTLLMVCVSLQANNPKKETQNDSLQAHKKGWNIGAVPGITYDNDKGLTYGLTANIFNYGNGEDYPNYRHFVYAEGSYSTKKVGTYRLFFESDNVIRNHKLCADFSYLPDAMNDFYGFNGGQSVYHREWEEKGAEGFLNHAFYRHKSNLLRVAADIRGRISSEFYYYSGIGLLGYEEGRVHLSSAYDTENQMELFELYRQWGLISDAEQFGGKHPYFHAGLSYDTRNQRVNTVHGCYFDVFVTYNAAFGKLKEFNNLKLNFDFMKFFPLLSDRLIMTLRFSMQNTIAGRSPYYLDTYHNVLYIDHNRYYALGGATSIRGVMRDRVWAPGFAFSTVEMRSKVLRFDFVNQHFYIGVNCFLDCGVITRQYDIDEVSLRQVFDSQLLDPGSWIAKNGKVFEDFFDFGKNSHSVHAGAGAGVKLAMNENFVLSVEWGMPFSEQDNYNKANFYIGMGYSF